VLGEQVEDVFRAGVVPLNKSRENEIFLRMVDDVLKDLEIVYHRLQQLEVRHLALAITVHLRAEQLQQYPHPGVVGVEFLQSLAHPAPL
jgi:hypothetical protein